MLQFHDGFEAVTETPAPFMAPNWDVAVHYLSRAHWYRPIPIKDVVGAACAGPDATHDVATYADLVTQCRGHVMTTIDGDYGAIYLMPDHGVDLSGDGATVTFDVSTARRGANDWIEVWLTPLDAHLAYPTQPGFDQIQGPPREAVCLALAPAGHNRFDVTVVRDGVATTLRDEERWLRTYDEWLEPSFRTRTTFRLKLSQTRLSFGLIGPADSGIAFEWLSDHLLDAPLPWSRAVVQFSHHSFHPTTACGNDGTCAPQAWHWDNVRLAPAFPLSLIHARSRYAEPERDVVEFEHPATPGSHLRFAAVAGANVTLRYRIDGAWGEAVPAVKQAATASFATEGRFQTYWTPAPAGADAVRLSADNWWGGAWHARDFVLIGTDR